MTEIDRPRRSPARTVAWALLLACTAGNLVLSLRGGALAAHAVVGVATLACVAALAGPYLLAARRNHSPR